MNFPSNVTQGPPFGRYLAGGGRTVLLLCGLLAALVVFADCKDPRAAQVKQLREQLKSTAPQAKLEAIWTLRGIGPAGSSAIPDITAILEEGDPTYRAPAAMALSGLDPEGKTVVPALRAALKDRHHETRAFAARSLAHIGKPAAAAVEDLKPLLEDPHFMVRGMTLFAMWRLTASAEHWATLLKLAESAPLEERTLAVYLVGESRSTEPRAVQALVRAASSQERALRLEGVESLAKLGPAAEPGIDALFQAFHDERGPIHTKASEALVNLDKTGKKLIPGLTASLSHRSSRVKVQAAYALGTYGAVSAPAISALRRTLRDPDPEVRGEAARTLGILAPASRDAASDLVAMLDDSAPPTAWIAAEALVALNVAPPALFARANAGSDAARRKAFFVLSRIKPRTEKITATLESATKDPDQEIQNMAKQAMGKNEAKGSKAAP